MHWKWAAASVRGTSHDRTGTRLQDAYACYAPSHSLAPFFTIVSDGAGSASFGGQGASLACRSVVVRARSFFARSQSLPSTSEIEDWVDGTRDLISAVATRRKIPTREFAATLVCAIAGPGELIVAHIGDGCVVAQDGSTGEWIAPSWPQHGEYASTTFFITDAAELRLRIMRVPMQVASLAIFSDGIERLVLDMAAMRPFGGFFDSVIRPILATPGVGRDPMLSAQLRAYLSSETVNARTDDDKTLILAARR